jgi:orotate phosphoribosyltransferase
MKTKKNIHLAKMALSLGALKLNLKNPFEWASGYRMPIYNDNRLLFRKPESRKAFIKSLVEIVNEISIATPIDVIAGTATAGIPWGSMLANDLDLDFFYIRDKSKNHGMRNQIEGINADENLKGCNVVIIEDLISTGGSSARAVQVVRNAGGTCYNIISIFNYDFDMARLIFDGQDTFDKEDPIQPKLSPSCRTYSVLNYMDLIDVVKEERYFNEEQILQLKEWRESPFTWGEKNGFPKTKK